MAHPDWVLKHKVPNTCIKLIRGRYYLYNHTSVWCPEKKRTKKITTGYIGVIDQELGLIPRGMARKGTVPPGESKLKNVKFEAGFMDTFEKIEDPRSQRNNLYTVFEILLVSFLAVIAGAEGWCDIEAYGKAKLAFLRRFSPFKNGIPSDDTFRRFFRAIDIEQFKAMFREWVEKLVSTVDVKVIAIDGKSSRRSYDGDENMLHMVSAFASEARIVLAQEKVADKSNEITAIPKLLNWLNVKGFIVTIDAMGCQYAIANQIIKKEGDYIFSLKGNQGSLSDDVKLYFKDPALTKGLKPYVEYDKGHGRIEKRECLVVNDVKWIKDSHPQWGTIKSLVRIDSEREQKHGEITKETRYYISSLENPTPAEALKAIRAHWGIENSLHWVLDMSFNEDYSRIRKGNAPHVMAIIKHFAINLIQQNKPPRQSVRGTRKVCAWNEDALLEIISGKKSS